MVKTYTKEELQIVLEKHARWLRSEDGGERANLSGADLRGVDLTYAYLRGVDLTDADLSYANLYDAYLYGAYLRGANLTGANLRDADLTGANLACTDLYVASADHVKGIELVVLSPGKHRIVYRGDTGKVRIGCQEHDLDTWLREVEAIGSENGYTPGEIRKYKKYLVILKETTCSTNSSLSLRGYMRRFTAWVKRCAAMWAVR